MSDNSFPITFINVIQSAIFVSPFNYAMHTFFRTMMPFLSESSRSKIEFMMMMIDVSVV